MPDEEDKDEHRLEYQCEYCGNTHQIQWTKASEDTK